MEANMAVGSWTFYNKFRKNMGTAGISLLAMSTRMALFLSTSNAATLTLSVIGSVTNQVTQANGYTTGGGAKGLLAGVTWTGTASAGSMRFNFTPARVWTAAAGTITGIKFAVLYLSGASATVKKLICFSQLSTANFNITVGNTLTINPSATGVFNMT
jgi:hypothetical protein